MEAEKAQPSLAPRETRRPPFSFAKRHGILIGNEINGRVMIFQRPDVKPPSLAEARRFVGKPLNIRTLSDDEFDELLTQLYDDSATGTLALMEGFEDDLDLASLAEALPEPQDLMDADDDAPIIRLINALLTQAVKEGASDIHIETFESRLSVRMRVDGVLREVLQPPRNLGALVVSRIKVMAALDIAEKRLPQDGRISLRVAGRPVDVRVSTLPSGHGERVVLRLLDKQTGRLDLEHLGLQTDLHNKIKQAIEKPHGIVLVTGPTGSGKTTTLYAALSEINDKKRNILTVEDPIEYFIDGIGQTQVNGKVDMTFARGLRAILRQDPDVVMVGEIRDLETASIAVQASLTGHMVFSTLHTNTAVGAITRMRDMGVEPFLLSSSLVAVLAQRLVRVLCSDCKVSHTATEVEFKQIKNVEIGKNLTQAPKVYSPGSCDACNNTGYSGRSGIYELVAIDEKMRAMIHDIGAEQELEKYAHQHTASIRQDGIRLVLEGVTTLEEVMRVTKEDVEY